MSEQNRQTLMSSTIGSGKGMMIKIDDKSELRQIEQFGQTEHFGDTDFLQEVNIPTIPYFKSRAQSTVGGDRRNLTIKSDRSCI